MRRGIKIAIGLLAFLGIFLLYFDADAQCSMCKAVVESNNRMGVNDKAAGLNQGILYLMGIPYILLIGVGIYLFRRVRQSKAS